MRMLCAAIAVVVWSLCVRAEVYPEINAGRFPDADSVIVDAEERIVYASDGTYTLEEIQTVKVLTEKGRREESVVSTGYNARYGKAEILSVEIEGDDGVRQVDIAATLKEATDNSSVSANIYDPLQRQLSCRAGSLRVGEALRTRIRRTCERARVENSFANLSVFEWSAPIVRSRVEITGPQSLPLKSIAMRHALGNVESSVTTNANSTITYAWTVRDSPQAFPEPDMPPLYTCVQHLRVSTEQRWQDVSRWYWRLCEPHFAATTPGITNQVKAIGRDLRAIYKFVAQEIRYMGLTFEDKSPGYAPHDVAITFENRYGVCRDKAALLAVMLRIAGYEAFPVLIHAGARLDPEVPMPYFNHAIVAVRAPAADGGRRTEFEGCAVNADGYVLMDPTDESSRDLLPSYLGDRSYLVACPEGEKLLTTPAPPPERNALKIDTSARIDAEGGMVAVGRISFGGVNDNMYRRAMLRRTPDERRKTFQRILAAAAPGAELVDFRLSPADLRATEEPLSAELTFRCCEAFIAGETSDELPVPALSRSLGLANFILQGSTSLARRRFPLSVDATAMVDEKVRISFENGMPRVARLPETLAIEGAAAYRREYRCEDGELLMLRRHAVGATEFSPGEYAQLRESIQRIEAGDRETPLFVRDPEACTDVRYLGIKMEYDLDTPRDWTLTQSVEKAVLTYAGKKSSAELRFAWNPSWQEVELIDASVSNRDGRVFAPGARERSEMDCAWAAKAPRYPASREMTVSLPGVEIGSVVRYTLVRRARNAPVPFRGEWFFDTFDSVDACEVIVRERGRTVFSRAAAPLKRLRRERMLPAGELWRDVATVAKGDLAEHARLLAKAAEPGRLDRLDDSLQDRSVRGIRDWFSRKVKIAGPSLYETALGAGAAEPAAVIAEGYASPLDYARTLAAVMRKAGYEAEVVFAAGDADDNPALVARECAGATIRPERYCVPLCQVRHRRGGWLGLGGETVENFIGGEDEYMPLAVSPHGRDSYLDPQTGATGRIPDGGLGEGLVRRTVAYVRENGAVDFEVRETLRGSAVGAFRRRYAEMLPEVRARHYQELLGELSQSAEATGELTTDIESYPAERSYSAYVPGFATVAGDTIAIELPGLDSPLFALDGSVRENPLGIGTSSTSDAIYEVVFPEGYAKIEHLPSEWVFADPAGGGEWLRQRVESRHDEKGRLHVVIVRAAVRRAPSMLAAHYLPLLKSWSAASSSRKERLLRVRKP